MRKIHCLSLMALLLAISFGCGKKETTGSTSSTPGGSVKPVTGSESPAPGGTGGAGTPSGGTETKSVGIEGDYIVVGGESFGKKMPAEEIAKEAKNPVKITKDTIQISENGKLQSFKYTSDPSKSPAQIDIVFPEGFLGGKKTPETSYGIYKLEGDTLTLFFMGAAEAKNRPKEFKTTGFSKEGTKDPVGGLAFVILKKK